MSDIYIHSIELWSLWFTNRTYLIKLQNKLINTPLLWNIITTLWVHLIISFMHLFTTHKKGKHLIGAQKKRGEIRFCTLLIITSFTIYNSNYQVDTLDLKIPIDLHFVFPVRILPLGLYGVFDLFFILVLKYKFQALITPHYSAIKQYGC